MTLAVHAFAEGETVGRSLAEALGASFDMVRTHVFPDGEILPTVPRPARTTVVYCSLDQPNGKLLELLLAAEAWRRLGAERLVLVAPYLAYMRQDAAFAEGEAISQRAVCGLLDGLFDRIVTVNAHLHRTVSLQSLFARAVAEDLTAAPQIAQWLKAQDLDRPVLLGPDVESISLVEAVAGHAGAPWAAFSKSRRGDHTVELSLETAFSLSGRAVVLVDDICSSGATLVEAAQAARRRGAGEVLAVVVHALMDASAEAALRTAGVSRIACTDSVPRPQSEILLSPLLSEALRQEG
ncbi:MAG: ribose-phosphate diphosphokinase [Caulobacteraceae bacterium]